MLCSLAYVLSFKFIKSPQPCQSGVFKSISGGGTGLKAVFTPHKGKTISCASPVSARNYGYAYVGEDGTPYVRAVTDTYYGYSDTGWIAGVFLAAGYYSTMTISLTSSGMTANDVVAGSDGSGVASNCAASWPL